MYLKLISNKNTENLKKDKKEKNKKKTSYILLFNCFKIDVP